MLGSRDCCFRPARQEKEATLHDDVADDLLLAQGQQNIVELVVLNTKEAELHDNFMPTCCSHSKAAIASQT